MNIQIVESGISRKVEISSEAKSEFMLAALRSARRRVDLIGAELDEIGVSLRLNMISPEFAVSWLDHNGLTYLVNIEFDKIEVAA